MARPSYRDRLGDWFARVLGLDDDPGAAQVTTDDEGFDWEDVASSNVEAIGWRDADHTLRIRFGVDKPATVYEYPWFPVSVMREFKDVGSKGGFVWAKIRNFGADDAYQYRKL